MLSDMFDNWRRIFGNETDILANIPDGNGSVGYRRIFNCFFTIFIFRATWRISCDTYRKGVKETAIVCERSNQRSK